MELGIVTFLCYWVTLVKYDIKMAFYYEIVKTYKMIQGKLAIDLEH